MKYIGVMNSRGATLPMYIEYFRWDGRKTMWIGSFGTTALTIADLRKKKAIQ